MAEHPDDGLEDYANFILFREAMTERARAVGLVPWNTRLYQVSIIARHFPDDAPPRGRNLECSRTRSEVYAEVHGPDWRNDPRPRGVPRARGEPAGAGSAGAAVPPAGEGAGKATAAGPPAGGG
eukprot:12617952-Alexandrium_andersonii.AAC.1